MTELEMKLRLIETRIEHLEEGVSHILALVKESAAKLSDLAHKLVLFRSEIHRLELDRSAIRVELMEALVMRGRVPEPEPKRGAFFAKGLYVGAPDGERLKADG